MQSVPADEGFWVGVSVKDRVWVQLTGGGESPYQVTKGDRVDFGGNVVEHGPGYAAQIGVDAAEGAELLTTEGAHIEVARGKVTLTQG